MSRVISTVKSHQIMDSILMPIGLILISLLILTGCNSGGSGSDSSLSLSDNTTSATGGVFIDSPVQGLNYSSPSGSGVTDENGYFVCEPGEMIQFMIGDVMLGETTEKDVVTPIDFMDAAGQALGFNDPRLVNMGRFLQSLDADGDPENGITITDEVREEVRGRMIDFDQSMMDFQNDPNVTDLFDTLNGLNIPHNGMMWELVNTDVAQEHMMEHMGQYMTEYMNEHMGIGGGTDQNSTPTDNTGGMPGQMDDYMNDHMGYNTGGTGANTNDSATQTPGGTTPMMDTQPGGYMGNQTDNPMGYNMNGTNNGTSATTTQTIGDIPMMDNHTSGYMSGGQMGR